MDGTRQIPGVVSSISRVGEEQTDKTSDAQYTAYVDFKPDETVRLDMTVSVYTQGGDTLNGTDDADGGEADEPDVFSNETNHD
jgi:hypothetical protein